MLLPLVMALLAAAGFSVYQPAAPAAPPGTDIHELRFDGTLSSLSAARPQRVAAERGYENQPHYTTDGAALLFTANRDGKQTDIFEFDRATGRTRALISTPEGEYSPTLTPDGRGVSVIRVESDGTQRLWRFDRSGANPAVLLPDIKPVGYHVWIAADDLALFVLGQPATLQRARLTTGKAEVIARDIGRSLLRTPGGRVSFVQRVAADEFWVSELDPTTGTASRLVRTAPGSSDRDCAWLPDGTLLMSAGTRLVAWRPGDAAWRDVADVKAHGLGSVSRLAVAPDGRALAIVVAEGK